MEFEPDSHMREGDFWPYYATDALRGEASSFAKAWEDMSMGFENVSLSRLERRSLKK
jgi:hypothetical protein